MIEKQMSLKMKLDLFERVFYRIEQDNKNIPSDEIRAIKLMILKAAQDFIFEK